MSLFRSVTRYSVSPGQNPQENRLTEVVAAVLERLDDFAVAFVNCLLDAAIERAGAMAAASGTEQQLKWENEHQRLLSLGAQLQTFGPDPRVRIKTQRTTANNKFVDLELRLGPPIGQTGKTVLIWVEVKHGADQHGTQLTDYLTDIELEEAGARLVIVLAPRQSPVHLTGPLETLPAVEWQRVADEVRAQLRGRRKQKDAEVELFLLTELLTYLAEEGLMDSDALNAEHAFVLSVHPQAEQTVAKLIEATDAVVQEKWGTLDQHRKGSNRYGPGYWTNYFTGGGESHNPIWRKVCFEWGMYKDSQRDEPRNAWVFAAGATVWASRDDPMADPENASWLAARRADGYERYYTDGCWRLWRHLYPEELLAKTEFSDQAAELSGWVLQAFRNLREHPPEH